MSFEIPFDNTLDEITSSKIFIGKSRNIDEDGLFSERIFGPEKAYRCKCGKLNSKIFDAGKRCHICNVLCEDDNLRMTTFGKVTVPFGFIKPNKRKLLYKILGNKNKQLLTPTMAQASLARTRYIGFKHDLQELKIFNDLKPDNKYIKLPLRITGIYSFILAIKFLAVNLNLKVAQDLFNNGIISFYVKVLPPKIRPLAYINNNEIQITDINKAYSNLIRRNELNKPILNNLPIDEEYWIGMINVLVKDNIFDEEIVEHGILEYDTIAAVYQYNIDLVYNNITQALHGKKGFIRSKILSKTIEFSARTIIRSNPSLKPYQISVSKKILYKLWHPYFLYYMINIRNLNADDCYINYSSKDYEHNKKVFNEFLSWFCEDQK